MSYTKMPKNAEKYVCEKCDFKCSKKSNYSSHLMTAKHKMITNDYNNDYKNAENAAAYMCVCGKSYKHRQGLYAHKKKCDQKMPENAENEETADSPSPPENIVHESINEATIMKCIQRMGETQAEQTRMFIEAISLNEPRSITNNNNTTNNQFNLNVFLNEDCKDAFTLKEVMDSIECTVTDLDRIDTDGYAATITRKILESMQNMSITERPIHCTDSRRNTVCVKDETGWEKNEKAMKLLINSVFFVGRKMGSMIDDWRVAYPDHFRGTVSRREQYHRLISDIMKVNDLDVEARIASKVCKGTVLDRKEAMGQV